MSTTLGEEFVGNFLAHYASQYYDPAKAHQYYMENRELSGKQSTSGLTVKYQTLSKSGKKTITKVNQGASQRRKEAWAYAKDQIGEHKKLDLKKLSEQHRQAVEKARQTAHKKRDEISSKLTDLLKLLTNQKADNSDKIDADEKSALQKLDDERAEKSRKVRERVQSEIDAIPAVPDSVRGPQRDRLLAARAKKIDKIKGDSATEIKQINEETAAQRDTISADADAQRKTLSEKTTAQRAKEHATTTANREKVSVQLKATVDRARADYEAGKARLIAQYEATSQKEYDAIKRSV